MTAINKQTDRFTETDNDEEIVVMRLDTGEFFSLDGTGAAIWRLIDGTRDRKAVQMALAQHFAGDEASIAADVDEFLQDLAATGLIADE